MITFIKYTPAGLLIFAIGLLSCANINNIAGAGSETTNSLTGTIASADGGPAVHAIVRLIPASYDPVKDRLLPDSFTSTTNLYGEYMFQNIDTGVYNIFVQNQSGNTRLLISDVHAITDTVKVSKATLDTTGSIKIVAPPDANSIFGYIYVPGTPLFAFLNNGNKTVILDSVPPGVIPKIFYSSTNDTATGIIRYNVEVKSSDTVVAANPSWAFTRRLFLNTTASGASIVNTVYNFPVLVKLNQSTFDFSQASTGGTDLRFTNADNRVLPHEIERWDSDGKKAEVWIRIDSVQSNNDRQFIIMYWGNPDASNISNSMSVFDTSHGFQGVWHLAGEGTGIAYDATANGYDGTPYNMSAVSAAEGVIGTARSFDGSSNYISMLNTSASRLNFPEDGFYSMSLWVYAETIDSIFHAIAGKGHEQYYMQFKCLKNGKATWEFVEFQDQNGWEYTQDSTPPAPGAKQWLYLTAVRSGTSQKFYINGEKVVDTTALMPGTYSRDTSDNFTIGSYSRSVEIPYSQGWSYFHGKIDEVRVSSVPLNDDWVRLCYKNQKMQDELVIFENDN